MGNVIMQKLSQAYQYLKTKAKDFYASLLELKSVMVERIKKLGEKFVDIYNFCFSKLKNLVRSIVKRVRSFFETHSLSVDLIINEVAEEFEKELFQDASSLVICGSPRKTRKPYQSCCQCKCTSRSTKSNHKRVFPSEDDSKFEAAVNKSPELKTLAGFLAEQEKKTNKVNKLSRGGFAAGTVMIIRAGKFKGKRVVFLMKLSNGLLLVTGLFKKVALRRVKKPYVIATSTKVDIYGMNVGKAKGKN